MWNRLPHSLRNRLGRRSTIAFQRAARENASITAKRGERATGAEYNGLVQARFEMPYLTDANDNPLAAP